MAIHVFTYGTLMYPEIWEAVTGGTHTSSKGTLYGYSCRCIKGEVYPGILPDHASSRVRGKIYFDITESELERLDIFEGDMYFRAEESIHLDEGKRVKAWVYVVKPDYAHAVESANWTQEWFEREGKKLFINKYRGFSRIKKK